MSSAKIQFFYGLFQHVQYQFQQKKAIGALTALNLWPPDCLQDQKLGIFFSPICTKELSKAFFQGLRLQWNTLRMSSCLRQECNDALYSPCKNYQSHLGLLSEMHFGIGNIIHFWVSFQCRSENQPNSEQMLRESGKTMKSTLSTAAKLKPYYPQWLF